MSQCAKLLVKTNGDPSKDKYTIEDISRLIH
jgi:hypothetical protein